MNNHAGRSVSVGFPCLDISFMKASKYGLSTEVVDRPCTPRNAAEVNYPQLAIPPHGTPRIEHKRGKRQQIRLERAEVELTIRRDEAFSLLEEDDEELLCIWRQIFTRGIAMVGLPLICVVQISGTPIKKHAHGCLSDGELLLEVPPCNLDKLLVAVGVKTKLWSNEVELKARCRLLLPAFNPLLHRVAVLDHSRWLLHDNVRVREFPRWT